MKRRDFLRLSGLTSVGAAFFSQGWVSAAEKKPQRILYYTRSTGYEHSAVKREDDGLSVSDKALIALGKRVGLDVTCSKDGRVFDGDLDQYDAFAFYSCGNQCVPGSHPDDPQMTAEGKQRLLDAVAAGKGFVGFHSAADTFHSGKEIDPYVAMVGGEFMGHGTQQPGRLKITSPKFPGLEDYRDQDAVTIEREEWYTFRNFNRDLHVILVQDTQMLRKEHERDKFLHSRPPFPQSWAREQGQGRVFYTSFGHVHEVWADPFFERLVLGGIAWALGNVDADVTPNIEKVTPGAWEIPQKA
ncbi:MAG: ThuA domain-containing protein [Thermoguttaceae bacterium]|jgi:type 1 glutamine amidotransferase|nr:ThuA domain-containing protein [Thermoguttaceae bacterium]